MLISREYSERLSRISLLVLVLSLLTACDVSTPSDRAPRLSPPPAELLTECSRPILIPEPTSGQRLTQLQVETFWSSDRRALIECAERNVAVINFYEERDRLISEN